MHVLSSRTPRLILALVLLVSAVFVLTVIPSAHAATPIYVRPGGDDALCNGTVDVDYSVGVAPNCAVQTIGQGVLLVDPGGTVNVAAGTYTAGAGNINKPVTLLGAQAGVDARNGRPAASESVITAGGLGTFLLNATDITFDGFKFTSMTGRTMDTYFDADNFTMRNCILQSPSIDPGYNTGAIQFGGGPSLHANGLLFEQNLVTADNGQLFYMGHSMDNGTFRNNKFNGDSVSFGPFGARTGWLIEGNEFDGNVAGHGPYWGFGFNANLGDVVIRNNYVHQMSVGIGQISVVNGSIMGNTFDDNAYAAFQLWGGEYGSVVSSNALIENNLIKYNGVAYDNVSTYPANGVRLRPAPDASTIHFHNNFFDNLGVGAAGSVWAIRQQGTNTADAEMNWWGTTNPAVIATMIGEGTADYEPWIVSYVNDPTPPYPNGFWPTSIVLGYSPCTTDCYVNDGTGNDANPGTLALPMKTIQKGIDTVATGGTVHVAAGTYTENVVVNKYLKMQGAGSTASDTVISGAATGIGLSITASGLSSANRLEISDLRVTNFTNGVQTGGVSFIGLDNVVSTANTAHGLELGNGTTDLLMTNCEFSYNTSVGIRAGTAATITGFEMDGCSVDYNNQGMYIAQMSSGASNFSDVLIQNSTFNENTQKGIYVEKLHNATFDTVTVDHSGWDTGYNFSAGVDINLKYRSDYANISFIDSTITDNGVGALYGVGLTIKARDDAPSYNGNPASLDNVSISGGIIDGNQVGVRFGEPGKNNLGPTNVTVSDVCFSNNVTAGLINETQTTTDAIGNAWGSPTGPYNATSNPGGLGDSVSNDVDFTPWLTTCGGSPTGNFYNQTDDSYFATMQDAVDAASTDDVIVPLAAGPFGPEGSATVAVSGVTIKLSGRTFGPGSPAFTINADDVTINGPGVLDGGGNASPGILVNTGADNFILNGVEIREWADGIEVAGSVTSFKLVNNWIHSNTDAGLQVNGGVTLGGVVTIQGNLFKVNGGNGVQNDSGNSVNATYNSWGDDAGPAGALGDGVSADVTYDPWTFAEVYIDVDPTTGGDQYVRGVDESTSFDINLNVDGENLYGLSFEFTYDPNFLTFDGPPSPTFVSPWAGNCSVVGTPLTGTFAYTCYLISGPAFDGGTVATFSFTADGSSLTGDGPWSTYFDISADPANTNAGAAGGIKVFVNNAGYNDPSTPDRDITNNAPPYDGQINITGIAKFTGFVDVQGRPNDSGAVVDVYDTNTTGGSPVASGTSVSSGSYTTNYIPSNLLTVGTTYYFQVDRALYLPTTVTNPSLAATWAQSKQLTTRPLTPLATFVLLGGDATDDNGVNLYDATCIGNQYGLPAAQCPTYPVTSSSDVNGDGTTNILDLVLFGGNYELYASPWTP